MNASLNANAKLSLRGFTICQYQAEINMGTKRNKACGADIHKNKIVATILSSSETKNQAEFGTTLPELFKFKSWLILNDCEAVAMESTGTYWIPVISLYYKKYFDPICSETASCREPVKILSNQSFHMIHIANKFT